MIAKRISSWEVQSSFMSNIPAAFKMVWRGGDKNRTYTFTKLAQENPTSSLLGLRESLCVWALRRQYYCSRFAPWSLNHVSVDVVTELSLCVTGMEERTNPASWAPGGESSPSYDSSRVRWATRQHLWLAFLLRSTSFNPCRMIAVHSKCFALTLSQWC